ncbi:16S rRNA (guanine(527)-N(7))-methyltransferase RsmG [Nocardia carnea]|uniref:Ribosomal RNA small subunit methyltransferase G n=1 Tax=Nocardia carnea TaxID=37328 RepID=A0ABW7TU66_9NOCA
MFHVKPELGDSAATVPQSPPPAEAESVFGERLGSACDYWTALATAGVERGLIGPREVPRLWERHILNCAVVGELIGEGASVVDIGSGAGLPGIPLALARPDLRITLVEPLLRRTVFLKEFIDAAGLEITVVRGRAEQPGVIQEAGGADVVTSRAVAPLAKLAEWSVPLLHEHGHMLALKGSSVAEELERDRLAVERVGAGNFAVLECGAGIIDPPTVVLSAERMRRSERPSKRPKKRTRAQRRETGQT